MAKIIIHNQTSILTQQKAEEIQKQCQEFCKLFHTPEQDADPDVIYTQPHNLNAIEEAKINDMTGGHVKFRLISRDCLYFKFRDCGKIYPLAGARAYNNICKKLLSVQDEVEQMRLCHEDFIRERLSCHLMNSTDDLVHQGKPVLESICEELYDCFLSDTQQLYYLPTLDFINSSIKDAFGGVDFYPELFVDDSSRIVLQLHTKYDNNSDVRYEKLRKLTCKRVSILNREEIFSHIRTCLDKFMIIEKSKNKIDNNKNNYKRSMKKVVKTKAVEQTSASQLSRENGQNNYEIAKKIAIYLVQINNNGSELADFAEFCGVSTASLVEHATHGAVKAMVMPDAIVLKESATGYESAFMTKFISDMSREKRLVEDLAQFINIAMSGDNHYVEKHDSTEKGRKIEAYPDDETSKDETLGMKSTNGADNDVTLEVNTGIVNAFNERFAAMDDSIIKYMSEVPDLKTRKQRLYSSMRKSLWSVGYKGDAHLATIKNLLTIENRHRYDMLLDLAA